jgi:hypothetical protein
MDTIPFKTLLDNAADKCGLLNPDGTIPMASARFLARSIETRMREGWRYYAWPSITLTEERAFRPIFSLGSNYALNDEVYDPETDGYYIAVEDGISGQAITDTSYWLPLTHFPKYVELRQEGRQPIGEVFSVTRKDPTISREPGAVPFSFSDWGVQFSAGAPNVVWICFRIPPPRFTVEAWTAGTYAQNRVVYYQQDCWLSLEDGNTETPSAESELWERQPVPAFLNAFVVSAVYADWLKDEGSTDKAVTERNDEALDLLADERNQFTRQQGQTQRYKVRVR